MAKAKTVHVTKITLPAFRVHASDVSWGRVHLTNGKVLNTCRDEAGNSGGWHKVGQPVILRKEAGQWVSVWPTGQSVAR